MKVGKKIKQLRELRNFTQQYMADQLNMSLSGYGKIERDESDITLGKLEAISKILDTNLGGILDFDSTQIFNQWDNQVANANGIVKNQQINSSSEEDIEKLKRDVEALKQKINSIKT